MVGRTSQRRRRAGLRLVVAASTVAVVGALPAGTAAAATLTDTASATVTLDTPGTLALDQFNPALGTLTGVQLSVTVDALVQVCIENTGAESAAVAGGTASGTLDAAFPGGAARAVATAAADGAAATLAAGDGTGHCTAGFDASAGRFSTPVSAGDVTFFEHAAQDTNSAALSGAQLAPFVGVGTVAVSYTASHDTDLSVPADWQNTAVAQGRLQAAVTYTYVVAGAEIPATGGSTARTVTVAIAAVSVGVAAVLIAKRWRAEHRAS